MRIDSRAVLLIVALFATGCAQAVEQRVAVLHGGNALLVPASGEGVDCLEQCTGRKNVCLASCSDEACAPECYGAHEHCIEDCPGAHWSQVQPPHQP